MQRSVDDGGAEGDIEAIIGTETVVTPVKHS